MTGNQTPPVPLVKAPGKTRLFLTFLCFISVLAVSAVVIGKELIRRAKPAAEVLAKGADMPKDAAKDWFYDEIGQGATVQAVAPAQPTEHYTLEIKLASSREEAEKIINMLAEMKVQAYYTPLARKGRVYYRVRRGLFSNKDLAQQAAQKLRTDKNVSTKVVLMQ